MKNRILKYMFRCKYGTCKGLCKCGKGESTTSVYTPTAPPAPSTADAIQAYIQGMPQMYQAQMEWAPKLAEQTAGLTEQYLPRAMALEQQLQSQYAPQQAASDWALQSQYAPLYAQQQQELQRQYEPEAYAAKGALGDITSGGYMESAPFLQGSSRYSDMLGGIMNQDYLTNYEPTQAPGFQAAKGRLTQDIRGAWADRGLATSGMSAENEAKLLSEFEYPYAMQMEQMKNEELARRQSQALALGGQDISSQESAYNRYLSEIGRRQNVGLSLAGRYNVATQPTVGTPQVSVPGYQAPNLMGDYSFGNVANQQMTGYQAYNQATQPLTLGKSSQGASIWGLM